MRITYDTDVDAVTLLVTSESVERTVDVGAGRFLDLDEDGNIVALEILDASRGFQLLDLMERYDLRPLIEEFIEHVRTARGLFAEGSDLRDVLVG